MKKSLVVRLLLVFLFVVLISAAVIYFTFDIKAIDYLHMFNMNCLLLAFGSLFVGLVFDGIRLMTLTSITGEKLPLKQVANVVLSNYFLALVTPGASGGAIAQVMFMRKAGIPVAKSTVVVLVRTIFSIIFLMLLVPFVLHLDPDIAHWMPPVVITVVSMLFTALPIVAGILMHTEYPEKCIGFCTRRFTEETQHRCLNWYRDFKRASFVICKSPLKVLRAFVESGLSLLFIYGCVPAYFFGMGCEFDLVQVMGRMVLLNLVLYFSPTPGGSGIAEAGFVVLFSKILPDGLAGIMAVMWRFTAEYVPFLIGGCFCIKAFGMDILNLLSAKAHKEDIAE